MTKVLKCFLNPLIASSRTLKTIKSSSWAIEIKMFIQLIYQNIKVMIDVFLACMMRVGCGIGACEHEFHYTTQQKLNL